MPDIISPTLEADEVGRLYDSIKNVISKDEADNVIRHITIAISSTPEERAEWVDKLSALLEKRYDVETIKQIR